MQITHNQRARARWMKSGEHAKEDRKKSRAVCKSENSGAQKSRTEDTNVFDFFSPSLSLSPLFKWNWDFYHLHHSANHPRWMCQWIAETMQKFRTIRMIWGAFIPPFNRCEWKKFLASPVSRAHVCEPQTSSEFVETHLYSMENRQIVYSMHWKCIVLENRIVLRVSAAGCSVTKARRREGGRISEICFPQSAWNLMAHDSSWLVSWLTSHRLGKW